MCFLEQEVKPTKVWIAHWREPGVTEKGFEQTAALSHGEILQCLEDCPTRGEMKVKTKTPATLPEYI